MRQLLLITNNSVNKISYYHIMLLMASLPFDRFYSHIILISLAVHTLIHVRKDQFRSLFNIRTLALQSVFWTSVVATIYSRNINEAFNEWTLRLPVLLLPVILSLNTIDLKKYRDNLLTVFAFVCTGTVVYLYADALITIRYYHLPLKAIFSPAFTNHNFSEPINMHATFFSCQLMIALTFLSAMLFMRKTLPAKVIAALCSCILLCGLIQLSSKSALFILFIMINGVIPFFLLKGAKRITFVMAGLMISVLAIVIFLNIPSFKERYLTSLTADFAVARPGESADPRLARWRIVASVIKQKPVMGHGTGSEYPLLHDEFFKAKMYRSFIAGLNAHNEYLSFWLKSGIWGLLVYLITLAYGLKTALQQKDLVFTGFMLVIIIISLSENVLDADKGVMYYSFFLCFFIFAGAESPGAIVTPKKRNEYLKEVATNDLAATSY